METCILFLILQEQFEPVCKGASPQHFLTCLFREFHCTMHWHNMQGHKQTFPLLTAELQLQGQIFSKKEKKSNYLDNCYKKAAPATSGIEKMLSEQCQELCSRNRSWIQRGVCEHYRVISHQTMNPSKSSSSHLSTNNTIERTAT